MRLQDWIRSLQSARSTSAERTNRYLYYPAEDNLNISLKDITVTQRDGRITQLDQVYIRGPMIRFYIVPDMLANAPMSVTVSTTIENAKSILILTPSAVHANSQVQASRCKRHEGTRYRISERTSDDPACSE